MEGDLSLVSIPDLLQMICLGGYNRDIHLFEGPTQVGVIAIRHGRVDRCFGFGMWGELAFYKLVNLRRGRYKVNEAQDMSGSDAALTAYSWQELLMEAARRHDEEQHVVQQQASSTGRVIAFPTPPGHAASAALPVSGAASAPSPPSVSPSGSASVTSSYPAHPVPATATGTSRNRVPQTMELPGVDDWSDGVVAALQDWPSAATAQPDITQLLEQATACYLRRDLARTEELLQQCLTLRPGDKRVLQNLERVRRKKPT
jgi:hypothetical protein